MGRFQKRTYIYFKFFNLFNLFNFYNLSANENQFKIANLILFSFAFNRIPNSNGKRAKKKQGKIN